MVHHEVGAAHGVGALGRRDPQVITAGVPHGVSSALPHGDTPDPSHAANVTRDSCKSGLTGGSEHDLTKEERHNKA